MCEFSWLWAKIALWENGVEQSYKLLESNDLKKQNAWNTLFMAVPRLLKARNVLFMRFAKFLGIFSLLFTSYSHRASLSLAVRREISQPVNLEQEKILQIHDFYFRAGGR